MTLEEFNRVYRYLSDLKKYGFREVWEIPELEEDGFIYGDCESYCRFLKNKIAEFKDWDYYYCKVSGEGHCVLYKDGEVIDCIEQKVMLFEQYASNKVVTDWKKQNWFVICSKILVGKALVWISYLR